MAEITEHCQGVKVVLVALKCDLREEHEKDDDNHEESAETPPKQVIQYQEGLDVARKIGALRYLGECGKFADSGVNLVGRDSFANRRANTECSAMRNRGVNEAFTEAARVALQVKPAKSKASSRAKCTVM